MTDIATLTRNAHATGFEQGSLITLQTILNYLDNIGGSAFAQNIVDASNDGTLNSYRPDMLIQETKPDNIKIEPSDPTELGQPKITREQARQSGYTGDICSCGSMQVRKNGTCTVCDSCGTTTGCS